MTREEIEKAKKEAWYSYNFKVVTGLYKATFYDGWDKAVEFLSQKTEEVSVKEILDAAEKDGHSAAELYAFLEGAKWMREQLKRNS